MKPAALVALLLIASLLGLVSARLLRLAARTRQWPEFLLGLSTGLPLGGYVFGFFGAALGHGVPAPWVTELAGGLVDLGFIATVVFVWFVFRRDERWAKAVSVVLAMALLSMPLINHWVPWDHGVPSALVPRSILRMSCYAWAAIESLWYARLMRRRVRFGLAEPLLADRFSLWGFTHICFGLMLMLIMIGVKLHLSGGDFARLCTFSGFFLGIVAAIPLVLSFFPPERYVRYVETRYRLEGLP
ncbi:MAG TPA: hypothetical protein PKA58_08165 [Polyangium sp.]|nr:hypothetical protein [Polyangium sp.]